MKKIRKKLGGIIMGRNSAFLALLLLVVSCAPKVVGIYNTSISDHKFNTFFVQTTQVKESLSQENKLMDKRLQDIIVTGLENKGLTSSSLPDLYVSYMMNVYNTSETTSNSYNSYGSPYSRSSYMYPSSFDYTTRTYKTGVFLIDIKNSRGKLIWQGSKTFKLRSKESVQATLPEICREIIAAFDPNHQN